MLCDVSAIDLTTEILGQKLAMPVALGPVGLSGMYARRGEVQAARAAQAAGLQFTLSTVSCCSLDEVASRTDKPIWFQLYITKDRGFTRDMLAKAAGHSCPVLLFTVDLPTPGSRYRDVHSGLHVPPGFAARRGACSRQWAGRAGPGTSASGAARIRSAISPTCSTNRPICSTS